MNASQLALTGELAEELTPEKRLLALPPGIHLDVPEDVYHARVLGFASKSAFDEFLRSPAHYYAWVTGQRSKNESRALRLGKALHCAVLEPERFAREYVLEPPFGDLRRTANKEARAAWLAEHADRKFTLRDAEGAATMGMLRSLAGHPTVAALFEGASCEVTARWDDGLVPSKARLDIYNPELNVIVDVKKTVDARPDSFRLSMARYFYDRQAALYMRGMRKLERPVDGFVFVAVEDEPPYWPWAHFFVEDDPELARARDEVERAYREMQECVERNDFPGYPDGVHPLKLPRWRTEM